jgi:cell division septum initiation protein DivIVA
VQVLPPATRVVALVTDHTLARADEVLTELVELVETARTVPMSSSCVIPRERTLDLLDALREVLPPEMIEARRLVAQRDRTLSEAAEVAEEKVRLASEQALEQLRMATEQSEALVTEARVHAHQLVEAAEAEQARLVSAASVQQAAIAAAAELSARSAAEAQQIRDAAGQYADNLTANAQGYAFSTLSDLVDHLQRLVVTAENGRNALTPVQAEPEIEPEIEPAPEPTEQPAEPVEPADHPS